ncbi:MAG: hypothetical protein ACLQVD_16290 [Capsulimonadaceae bacterium]
MASSIAALQPNRRARPKWMDTISYWFRPYELISEEDEKAGKIPQFRYVANAVEVWGLQTLCFFALAVIAPRFWHAQIQGGVPTLVVTFVLVATLLVGPGEWFFHRFGMHRLLAFRGLEWLKIVPEDSPTAFGRRIQHLRNGVTIRIVYYVAKMAFSHGAHHKVTDVTPMDPSRLAELFDAISRYEITTNQRTEHAVFPHFSVVLFWSVFAPLMAVLQLAANACQAHFAPHGQQIPIVTTFLFALSWQVWLYETSHATMHKPYRDWWRPRTRLPLVGRWYSMVYRFHFFHHMNESCSLGVVGVLFFNYMWDRIFGTYKLAREALIEEASTVTRDVLEMSKEEIRLLPGATPEDFADPRPKQRWLARLDEESVRAREIWNQLFVDCLKEVRRRRGVRA